MTPLVKDANMVNNLPEDRDDTTGSYSVAKVASRLKARNCPFIAVSETALREDLVSMTCYLPPGSNREEIVAVLENVDEVTIAGETYPFVGARGIHTQVHDFRQVVLHADETVWPSEEIELENGLDHLRAFAEGRRELTPIASQSASFGTIASELVEEGAVAIGLEKELSNHEQLGFVVHLHPKTGYDVVGDIGSVTVNGRAYDVRWQFNSVDGPHFSWRVPIWAAHNIVGMENVPLDRGLENLREFLSDGGEVNSQ